MKSRECVPLSRLGLLGDRREQDVPARLWRRDESLADLRGVDPGQSVPDLIACGGGEAALDVTAVPLELALDQPFDVGPIGRGDPTAIEQQVGEEGLFSTGPEGA